MKIIFTLVVFTLSASCFSQTVSKLWETEAVFAGPESIAYDSKRDLLYVSNLRKTEKSDIYYGNNFISKVSLSGKILELKWIKNLTEPTGITIFQDRLYIVERFGVVVFDIKTESVIQRIRVPSNGFLNDVAVHESGTIFVSDSDSSNIFSIKEKNVEVWYSGPAAKQTNGIFMDGDNLLMASNADAAINAINVHTKKTHLISHIKRGVIDGIQTIGNDYLVSLFEGYLFRITKTGKYTEIMNTTELPLNNADFVYIEKANLLVVPALWQHKLVAFKLEQE